MLFHLWLGSIVLVCLGIDLVVWRGVTGLLLWVGLPGVADLESLVHAFVLCPNLLDPLFHICLVLLLGHEGR